MTGFGLKLEHHYAKLPGEFYTLMPAEQLGVKPRLIHANSKSAALIGLNPACFSDPDFVQVFSGHAPLEDFSPLAMVYSGHQFGVWAGQLGDGRALLIGQARQHRTGLAHLPHDRLAGGHNRQRPAGGNAQRRHRLAAEIFADGGAHHRPAVTKTGIGRAASAFQLDVPKLAFAVAHLANQQRPPITQLPRPDAELMA